MLPVAVLVTLGIIAWFGILKPFLLVKGSPKENDDGIKAIGRQEVLSQKETARCFEDSISCDR